MLSEAGRGARGGGAAQRQLHGTKPALRFAVERPGRERVRVTVPHMTVRRMQPLDVKSSKYSWLVWLLGWA